jgi:23S rRNA pseudouridine1911/1915/1917 synthase
MNEQSSQNFNRYTENSTTGLKIIFKNDRLLVVDKPAGLTVEDIAKQLKEQCAELKNLGDEYRYGIVHRLDKDTSGALLVAKTKEAFYELQKQFAQRLVEKRYICLVEGTIKQDSGVIHTLLARSPQDRRKQRTYPLDGRPLDKARGLREAVTQWKVLNRFVDQPGSTYTMLEVLPKTGRKHQIRVHMASLGNPIAGDKLYRFKNQQIPKDLHRQFLHANSIKIEGQEYISQLPDDLQQVLKNLKQHDN